MIGELFILGVLCGLVIVPILALAWSEHKDAKERQEDRARRNAYYDLERARIAAMSEAELVAEIVPDKQPLIDVKVALLKAYVNGGYSGYGRQMRHYPGYKRLSYNWHKNDKGDTVWDMSYYGRKTVYGESINDNTYHWLYRDWYETDEEFKRDGDDLIAFFNELKGIEARVLHQIIDKNIVAEVQRRLDVEVEL